MNAAVHVWVTFEGILIALHGVVCACVCVCKFFLVLFSYKYREKPFSLFLPLARHIHTVSSTILIVDTTAVRTVSTYVRVHFGYVCTSMYYHSMYSVCFMRGN